MRLENFWILLQATFVVVCVAIALGVARPSWAGPYLRTTVEYSTARSTPECGGQVTRALRRMEKEKHLDGMRDGGVAWTKASTLVVECLFVGKSDQRSKQWIFYIAIAGTDEEEWKSLWSRVRNELKKSRPID
jgi:hypothetical protein